ncbi:hypothetical protein QI893_00890 [Clostridioides difficile]|nr:hypothetical protein [Clostridioides difficile]MCC9640279.1 hypothetical protein [Clostridioides difficile]MCD8658285.1 hypothetical protein [Clostridioides difficile]MCD8681899.1 hypothetical protein [Clostridioides difficile]MCD8693939.1 hypothetical protein [Clostridioides difficile]MCE0580240.1 hypothetical protein [Clostridioides difficile]
MRLRIVLDSNNKANIKL